MKQRSYRVQLRNTGNFAEFPDKESWVQYKDIKLYERNKRVYTEIGEEVSNAAVRPYEYT